MERVVLLNSDYSFLSTINWKRAMCLLAKGKVEVLKTTEHIIRNAEKTWEILVPKVIRLVKLVRKVYRNKVPWSKKNVLIRDRYTCQYCGIKSEKMTIDHVIPSSKGGKSSFENCVASCKQCNNFKNDRTPSQAQMTLKRQPFQPTIMEFINIKMKALGIDKVLQEVWDS